MESARNWKGDRFCGRLLKPYGECQHTELPEWLSFACHRAVRCSGVRSTWKLRSSRERTKQIKWRTVYLWTTVNSTAPKNAIACAVWISQQQEEKLFLNMCTDALESARVLFAQICFPMALECNLLKVIIAWISGDQLFSECPKHKQRKASFTNPTRACHWNMTYLLRASRALGWQVRIQVLNFLLYPAPSKYPSRSRRSNSRCSSTSSLWNDNSAAWTGSLTDRIFSGRKHPQRLESLSDPWSTPAVTLTNQRRGNLSKCVSVRNTDSAKQASQTTRGPATGTWHLLRASRALGWRVRTQVLNFLLYPSQCHRKEVSRGRMTQRSTDLEKMPADHTENALPLELVDRHQESTNRQRIDNQCVPSNSITHKWKCASKFGNETPPTNSMAKLASKRWASLSITANASSPVRKTPRETSRTRNTFWWLKTAWWQNLQKTAVYSSEKSMCAHNNTKHVNHQTKLTKTWRICHPWKESTPLRRTENPFPPTCWYGVPRYSQTTIWQCRSRVHFVGTYSKSFTNSLPGVKPDRIQPTTTFVMEQKHTSPPHHNLATAVICHIRFDLFLSSMSVKLTFSVKIYSRKQSTQPTSQNLPKTFRIDL